VPGWSHNSLDQQIDRWPLDGYAVAWAASLRAYLAGMPAVGRHVGQADQQLAHARRFQLHRGSRIWMA
jgi:hypothetical protein